MLRGNAAGARTVPGSTLRRWVACRRCAHNAELPSAEAKGSSHSWRSPAQDGSVGHHTAGLYGLDNPIRFGISDRSVTMSIRTTAFVDGLNLYHGIRDEGHLKFRWLDIEGMVDSLAGEAGGSLGMSLDVTRVVYCTSIVTHKQASRRQDIYLQALEQHCKRIEIRRGSYEEKVRVCANCNAKVGFQTEKQTDVNLAVEMVMDAMRPEGKRAEVQLLVTGDTDLLPAIRAVRDCGVEVVAIAPTGPRLRPGVLRGGSVENHPGASTSPAGPPSPGSGAASNKHRWRVPAAATRRLDSIARPCVSAHRQSRSRKPPRGCRRDS